LAKECVSLAKNSFETGTFCGHARRCRQDGVIQQIAPAGWRTLDEIEVIGCEKCRSKHLDKLFRATNSLSVERRLIAPRGFDANCDLDSSIALK
jgi:hypothetical protein